MLRRVAKALRAKVPEVLEPGGAGFGTCLAESPISCCVKRSVAK